jgi:hypothetical protein
MKMLNYALHDEYSGILAIFEAAKGRTSVA